MIEHTLTVSPRFADTDAFGMVHHAAYLSYIEEAKFSLLDRLMGQLPGDALRGQRFVVMDVSCRYLQQTAYRPGLVLDVKVEMALEGDFLMRFTYEVLQGAQRVCRGASTHVAVDEQGGPVYQLPAAFVSACQLWEGTHADLDDGARLPVGTH